MPKILIVDDEVKFLELMQMRLESDGHEIVTAKDGADGLEKVRVYKPDLIISDALMPVMDGYTFYKKLKEDRATLKIPVLILTARINMEDAFMIAGVDEFLTKPVDADELLEKVNKLLNLN